MKEQKELKTKKRFIVNAIGAIIIFILLCLCNIGTAAEKLIIILLVLIYWDI